MDARAGELEEIFEQNRRHGGLTDAEEQRPPLFESHIRHALQETTRDAVRQGPCRTCRAGQHDNTAEKMGTRSDCCRQFRVLVRPDPFAKTVAQQ